jgi:molybdopterin converting factor small subunit
MTERDAIVVDIPAALRKYTGNAPELLVPPGTVRAALGRIERDYPALYPNLCDETGAVRRHLNIFVNSSHVRDLDGLDTRLTPGDVLSIMIAVSGG